MPIALVIEDEALPRARLRELLHELWPELSISEAVDGPSARQSLETVMPDVAFIDLRLPGIDGLELARHIAGRCHVVFVTAFDDATLAAFEQGALDYVLKPVERDRLARTVSRLQARLNEPPADLTRLLQSLAPAASKAQPLRWLQTGNGKAVRLLPVNEVVYFESDAKYTRVLTRDLDTHIRLSIRELVARIDAEQFWQIHRSLLVSVAEIASVERDLTGRMQLRLKSRPEVLPVSQSFQWRFRLS